ncbi:hypothetical protein FACS189421_10070 [Bacteroidia bacterium]|jgi:hypothetical protein|nr:hypothetical protein FACS189421_10070 [Bacteroidia bacterium]GHT48409.1 hypothetical protein FACS189440_11930 [Bacteroidia bacterium]
MVDQAVFSKPDQKELLLALMEKNKHEKRTRREELATFQAAGILDRNGKFTEPYSHLAMIFEFKM